jgi:hypothetical protein
MTRLTSLIVALLCALTLAIEAKAEEILLSLNLVPNTLGITRELVRQCRISSTSSTRPCISTVRNG